jgi:CheY-like chemotaxis protein
MKNAVLLVEDEQKTADMLAQALESEGIAVTRVADGRAAIAVVEKGRFDLIVLDLKLPHVAGDEVLEAIRRVDPYVNVVVYTNYQDPPVMKKLINLGVERYINKGAAADLWDTVEEIKRLLNPFTEREREQVITSAPPGTFEEVASKKK